ncbi:MAG: hypothetical protein QXI36_02045 [Candidatus Bathyarchaeia archaeon]
MAEDYAKWLENYVWNSYTGQFGHSPSRITKLELGHLTRFFVDECKKRGIDPEAVDFYGEIFEDTDYYELKGKIIEVLDLIKALPKEPVEVGLDEALSKAEELGFIVKEEDLRKVENVKALEDKIDRLSRNVEKLRRELELEKVRKETAQKELERIRAGAPPPTKPTELTEAQVEELHKLWELEVRRVLGTYPREAKLYFEAEIVPTVKTMSYEKARETVIKMAASYMPAPKVERVPVAPPRVEIEVPEEWAIYPAELPKYPLSPLPFPRATSSEEERELWKYFMYEMARVGRDPREYRERFDERIKLPYKSWDALIKSVREFIADVEAGKPFALIPLHGRVAMPWREDTEENWRFDAICHLTSTGIYETIEDLIYSTSPPGLEAYGVTGVTPEEVKKTIKKGWKGRSLWFAGTPRGRLEKLIGEPLE